MPPSPRFPSLPWATAALITLSTQLAAPGPAGAGVTCTDLGTSKFVETDLADAVDPPGGGSELWTVQCPEGAEPCPVPTGSLYTPIHSGEHVVHYQLLSVAEGVVAECFYSLFVAPPGLQVELAWEWDETLGPSTVDLDLHLHKPADNQPWGGDSGTPVDCAWSNCRARDFDPASPNPDAPDWFEGVAPPDPVDWHLSPIFAENSCYFMPQDGSDWQAIGLGCHNPRQSLDNIVCDPLEGDPADLAYCHPETSNIDYMPLDKWTRIGVHYFSNQGQTYDVHPKVKIFCHRELVLELGDATPSEPGYSKEVTFTPADGGTMFWLVADVRFFETEGTGLPSCEVRPLYADQNRAPFYSTVSVVQTTVGPPYPPAPLFADGFESGDTSAWPNTVP